jgi:hypothetical protein
VTAQLIEPISAALIAIAGLIGEGWWVIHSIRTSRKEKP